MFWTINCPVSEEAFHLWVGSSEPKHSNSLGKLLAADGSCWVTPHSPSCCTRHCQQLPHPLSSHGYRDTLIQPGERFLTPSRLHSTVLPSAGGDTSLSQPCAWDKPHELSKNLQTRQTDQACEQHRPCSRWTGRSRYQLAQPTLDKLKNFFTHIQTESLFLMQLNLHSGPELFILCDPNECLFLLSMSS